VNESNREKILIFFPEIANKPDTIQK